MPAAVQEAEIGDVLDSMAAFALSEMGPASTFGADGIKKAFGQQIPEAWDGTALPQMLFWVGRNGGTATPRTEGATRAGYGQWTDTTEIQGALVLAVRPMGVPALMLLVYKWVRRVWSAFWKHQQLKQGEPPAGLVLSLKPVDWVYRLDMPWGTQKFGVVLFTWEIEQVIRSVPAGQ